MPVKLVSTFVWQQFLCTMVWRICFAQISVRSLTLAAFLQINQCAHALDSVYDFSKYGICDYVHLKAQNHNTDLKKAFRFKFTNDATQINRQNHNVVQILNFFICNAANRNQLKCYVIILKRMPIIDPRKMSL